MEDLEITVSIVLIVNYLKSWFILTSTDDISSLNYRVYALI